MTDAHARTNATHAATRTAAAVLIVATVLVIAGIFALTAHGNWGYGRDVMKLGERFALAVPVALDVLQIVAIAAAFMLARQPLRVRAYAWSVFGVANAASIAANLADAQARNLPWQGWIGAGTLPVLLSLGVHLAVVTWRHRPISVAAPAAQPEPVDAQPVAQARPAMDPPAPQPVAQSRPTPGPVFSAQSISVAPPTPTPKPTPPPATRRRPPANTPTEQRAQARELYAAGTGIGEILKQWNGTAPARRTVEGWTQDLRNAHAQARAARTNAPPEGAE